jgi:molybdenum cofactor cytidylyltransferase
VLAAGGSTRSREPKQQFFFQGKELLRHSVDTAIGSVCEPVCVVLGAGADKFEKLIEDLPVIIAENREWESGVSSTIKTGLNRVEELDKELDAVLFMTMDQPLVTSKMLDELVELFRGGHSGIAACSYNETVGVPALFARSFFSSLKDLEGDQGAKQVILQNLGNAVRMDCPEAGMDIDSEEDLSQLNKK